MGFDATCMICSASGIALVLVVWLLIRAFKQIGKDWHDHGENN